MCVACVCFLFFGLCVLAVCLFVTLCVRSVFYLLCLLLVCVLAWRRTYPLRIVLAVCWS